MTWFGNYVENKLAHTEKQGDRYVYPYTLDDLLDTRVVTTIPDLKRFAPQFVVKGKPKEANNG